jgi:hypothetical protein
MVKVNIALVRLLQFVVFVLFTFMVLAYFGAMVLVPLDLVVLMIKIMGVVGINDLFAAVVAVPVVGYLGLIAYKTPGLAAIIIETGMDLVNTGKQRVEAFNKIADSIKA